MGRERASGDVTGAPYESERGGGRKDMDVRSVGCSVIGVMKPPMKTSSG
jgi:hypothetical protein